MTDVLPTPVQRLAIPALLGTDGFRKRHTPSDEIHNFDQFLLAAETGSGKTLAYLLPIIDAIKRAEAIEAQQAKREEAQRQKEGQEKQQRNIFELESPELTNDSHPTTGRPRAIVLVPTAELVDQVLAVAKSLSHTVKFRSAGISAAYTAAVIRNSLFSPRGIDILISTPHLLSSIADSDPNILSRVQYLVIDEADSLLDRSFAPLTTAVLDRVSPSLKQLVLCSATIPRSLDSFLRQRFPDIRRLTTPNLHAIPRRVQLGVVDATKEPYRGNKDPACADTIWSIGRSAAEHNDSDSTTTTLTTTLSPTDPNPTAPSRPTPPTKETVETKRILVFVNERDQSLALAAYLRTKGIDASALSRDVDNVRTSAILAAFTGSSSDPMPASPPPTAAPYKKGRGKPKPLAPETNSDILAAGNGKRNLLNTKVLVCTDLGSRGIDTTAVRHVVLYDVPHTTIDFIHRLGRTGRMGRRGRGVVLVGRGDRRDVIREVREGMFLGKALI